jgi:FixJ family two-component response regulator
MVESAPYVAIVDDELQVRRALDRLLKAAGLETQAFGSGAAYLRGAALRAPDCLVLDLHIPGMSGLELLRELQASGRQVPTVVITADDAPEARRRCEAAGASAYLRKPLDDQLLLDAISSAIAQARAAARKA